MVFRSRSTTAKGDERLMKRLMKKGLSPQTEKGVSKQKQKDTPNDDVKSWGVVVVDLKRRGIWVLDPMKTLKKPHGP
jgi:SOS response regulatory protein OraA/RecX